MPSPIKSMFNEVQYELVKIILLKVFLSTVIVFLIADIVSLFFDMPIWYSIFAATVYFIVSMISNVRKISITHVEKANPELREILRTANDNMNEDSLMAHALFFEVLEKMKRVSSGTFITFKPLMVQILLIFLLSAVPVYVAYSGVNVHVFSDPLARPLAIIGGFFGKVTGQQPSANVTDASSGVFGDPSMAKLGSNQLVATVNPALNSPDFNNVDPANPSGNSLSDLGVAGQTGFNTPSDSMTTNGLSQRDQERSYNYAQQTQGTAVGTTSATG